MRLPKRNVASVGNIERSYLHLLGIYNCKLNTPCLVLHCRGGCPYRQAYLPSFDLRSRTLSKCMSIGTDCELHCRMKVESAENGMVQMCAQKGRLHEVLPLHHNEYCSNLQGPVHNKKKELMRLIAALHPLKGYLRQKKHAQTLPGFTSMRNVSL